MSNILDKIKNVFVKVLPPVVMPQKRYIVLGVTLVYLITKQIVLMTPTKVDDELLEQIHSVAMQLIQNAASIDSINSVSQE